MDGLVRRSCCGWIVHASLDLCTANRQIAELPNWCRGADALCEKERHDPWRVGKAYMEAVAALPGGLGYRGERSDRQLRCVSRPEQANYKNFTHSDAAMRQ
jgi:hypothetical protein